MESLLLPGLTDRIFQQCATVTDMLISDLLSPVEMSEGGVIKVSQNRNIYIVNTAHTQQL